MPRLSILAAGAWLAGISIAQAQAQAPLCEVSGRAYFRVVVTAGGARFPIELYGARATVRPDSGPLTRVQVTGPLAFSAQAAELAYRPGARVVAAEGMVELGEMTTLSTSAARGDHVTVTADLGGGVRLLELTLQCSAITIEPPPAARRQEPSAIRCGDAYYQAGTRGRRLAFRAHPSGGRRVLVELPDDRDLWVCEVERRGAWVRVATIDTVHLDGRITGWLLRSDLRRLRGSVGFTGGRGFLRPPGPGRMGFHGSSLYYGPARLRVGALVHASPGGASWATVTDGTVDVVVLMRDNQDWVAVIEVPGLGPTDKAWISRAAVVRASPAARGGDHR